MFKLFLSLALFFTVSGAGAGAVVYDRYSADLPDYQALEKYEPDITTRVLASDGRLMAEYATEKRIYVPIDAMPDRIRKAFIAAEDKNFYTHSGVDFVAMVRAMGQNVESLGSGRRPKGASTITQQVAKNFLLTPAPTLDRKIKEAILAFRIEQAFSKDYILELYLNEIFLGMRSYGVAAAALNYFNKSLDELTLGETAFLAALPKGPNNYHPERHPEAAKARRDWVLQRMQEDGYITAAEADAARAEPIVLRSRDETQSARNAGFFSEEVRRIVQARFGDDALYKGGLYVRTTMDPALQEMATRALQNGLMEYDRRHGWRGPVARLPGVDDQWAENLKAVSRPQGMPSRWRMAVVLRVDPTEVKLGFEDGYGGQIPMSEMTWARPVNERGQMGATPKKPSDILAPGDIILVEPREKDARGKALPAGTFSLRQIPAVEGALVAMDPHTGRVLAMVGGFSPERSEFNRVTQALRQPGSVFKPFVYLAALDHGYTPATLILDEPFVYKVPGAPAWSPRNYGGQFFGPTTLRIGVEKSRNLMTVRLANAVGMDTVAEYAERFGVVEKMPRLLSAALGAVETRVIDITTAYAMLVNGGRRIHPVYIDRIQDRHGVTVFRSDTRPCDECQGTDTAHIPSIEDNREIMTDPLSAYQMVSILQGVVQRGTGARVAAVGKTVAGKTGTSNDSRDTWFVGFSPDLAVGVFVGFDTPRSLGSREAGSTVAAPIFTAFMKEALAGKPDIPFRVPPGINFVRIDRLLGYRAGPDDPNAFLEAFKPGTEPSMAQMMTPLDGSMGADGYDDPNLWSDDGYYIGRGQGDPSQPQGPGVPGAPGGMPGYGEPPSTAPVAGDVY
ncbi:penicillin-binding protein 1A [Phaeovibrio sulfidiphilus]|uniref:Penicillin-binding protein 1A n=1 Tax=Phaeovibrio sulfidiphilus TaxID=1220600 RepID=A0A8J6YI84_9PROT|nr:penicillin-binding protein 1A [Phaeovibrio sulfidiphilus]MBE1236726.1 penicillin-binding protein 1A [Phaeovibrio sulfidiphilus]